MGGSRFGRKNKQVINPYTMPDFYAAFIIEYATKFNVDYKTFRRVVEKFIKAIMEEVIVNNFKFVMPYGLGSLEIVKYKLSLHRTGVDNAVNWVATKQAGGKRIFYTNEHSGGYKYIYKWTKRNNRFKFGYFYKLIMTRSNKRRLAKEVQNGNDYVISDIGWRQS
jgi:hypothetical protein